MNAKNLRIMADHLRTVVRDEEFEMAVAMDVKNSGVQCKNGRLEIVCNTVGCIAGHTVLRLDWCALEQQADDDKVTIKTLNDMYFQEFATRTGELLGLEGEELDMLCDNTDRWPELAAKYGFKLRRAKAGLETYGGGRHHRLMAADLLDGLARYAEKQAAEEVKPKGRRR